MTAGSLERWFGSPVATSSIAHAWVSVCIAQGGVGSVGLHSVITSSKLYGWGIHDQSAYTIGGVAQRGGACPLCVLVALLTLYALPGEGSATPDCVCCLCTPVLDGIFVCRVKVQRF